MEEELGRQLLIRGTKGSRKVTLTEEGMILRKRAEEIMDLVEKTEKEILLADDILMGDIYIGTGETDAVREIAKAAKNLQDSHPGVHFHISSLNIVATYNLLFNASLMVEEGFGYAVGLDKIINTGGDSLLCFRPLYPVLENEINIIWKKYQIFSKPAGKFINILKEMLLS